MKLHSVMMAAAAAAVAAVPAVAQAGTVAGASVPQSTASLAGVTSRKSTTVEKKQNLNAGTGLLIAAAGGFAVWGLVELIDDDNGSNGG
ncbi:hypothetical protein HT136_08195 [Novosphingobium profundi]|uniref:hypothetical protein n=1 Tax=Novosphingobium profundi TaxID=1774954 RepID=UPI001BD99D17|nr:hypothetical protein [Novosphingobium profundi]MBT0668347.1 hypothetical protein [Novosphingobium profundi]